VLPVIYCWVLDLLERRKRVDIECIYKGDTTTAGIADNT